MTIHQMLLGAGEKLPIITYRATQTFDVLSANSYTFTNMPIGVAHDKRLVVAVICGGRDANSEVVSVTIGGVTATKITGVLETGTSTHIWAALVPTGTTANVACTWNTGINQVTCSCILYTVEYAKNNTPYITVNNTNTGNPYTFTETMLAKSVVLAVFQHRSTRTCSWSGTAGATEDTDYSYHPNNYYRTTASGRNETEGSRTVVRTLNTAPNNATRNILIVWR